MNLPEIHENTKNDYYRKIRDDFNEGWNQIKELRKINYENDLYRKNRGPKISQSLRNKKLYQ